MDRTVFHNGPVGINERVFPSHFGGKVDPQAELVVVLWAIVIEEPAPGSPAGLDPESIFNDRGRIKVGNEGRFNDRCKAVTEDDNTPWSCPWQFRGWVDLAGVVSFAFIGEADAVETFRGVLL